MRKQVIKNEKAISNKKLCDILRNFLNETDTAKKLRQYSKKPNDQKIQCLCVPKEQTWAFCF